MASYPGLPDNRLIVNGIDLSMKYGLILIDGYELDPPSPKTTTVDIPGANGSIDLTEALNGDVVYDNRTQKFVFKIIYNDEYNAETHESTIKTDKDFEITKTLVSNFLHGKEFDYKLTFDPEYTYHGRFSVDSYDHEAYSGALLGDITITIDAKPYKFKEKKVFKLNAFCGKWFSLESGRRMVRPIIETKVSTTVQYGDVSLTVPTGTYRLNNVIFKQGTNKLYINTYQRLTTKWEDVLETGKHPLKWEDCKTKTWDELEHLDYNSTEIPQSWKDLSGKTWSDISDKKWSELNLTLNDTDTSVLDKYTVYVTYDWEDL